MYYFLFSIFTCKSITFSLEKDQKYETLLILLTLLTLLTLLNTKF